VDTERDYYMSALEAKDYGLIDAVTGERPGTAVDSEKSAA